MQDDDAIENYVNSLISRYPCWNTSIGADHCFFSCHDVGSRAIQQVPFLMKNAIRLVCSPIYDSSYIPQKDVALPQIMELSLPPNVESRTFLRSPKMIQPPRWRKNTKSTFLDASWLIWTAVKSGITVANHNFKEISAIRLAYEIVENFNDHASKSVGKSFS
ncbi:hypothetical protein POTOM_028716 [Populus tomentosa]|uniref:Exostosin GT47 domain-containing protein n=1 Tax=Populus tomentosa TaxID=118781 RepID=A0A8X8CLM6_POPTO|nr:hypothetical protein POTOM_028716 [Populus tomentosa]